MKIGKWEFRLRILDRFFSYKNKVMIYHRLKLLSYIFNTKLITVRNDFNWGVAKLFCETKEDKIELQKKILQLKSGLDEDSQAEIDLFLNRTKYIYTHNLIELSKLFTDKEKQEQKVISKEMRKIKPRINKFKFDSIMSGSFYALSGAVYLSNDIQKKLEGGGIYGYRSLSRRYCFPFNRKI